MIREAEIRRYRGSGYSDDRRALRMLRARFRLKEVEIASAAFGGGPREW
jgi:hypothetical protein